MLDTRTTPKNIEPGTVKIASAPSSGSALVNASVPPDVTITSVMGSSTRPCQRP